MPITKMELKIQIQAAYDFESGKDLEEILSTEQARERIAQKIADAVEAYVVGRQVQVTGIQPGSGTAPGVIQ